MVRFADRRPPGRGRRPRKMPGKRAALLRRLFAVRDMLEERPNLVNEAKNAGTLALFEIQKPGSDQQVIKRGMTALEKCIAHSERILAEHEKVRAGLGEIGIPLPQLAELSAMAGDIWPEIRLANNTMKMVLSQLKQKKGK
ncbi:MAG: hypothetical protein NTW59_05465 [Candidatus Diapherotrites archaeon]|nr:hypothetical protein [Candidatus Diapherotrites archaeon]